VPLYAGAEKKELVGEEEDVDEEVGQGEFEGGEEQSSEAHLVVRLDSLLNSSLCESWVWRKWLRSRGVWLT
jgi:hypothetical protein